MSSTTNLPGMTPPPIAPVPEGVPRPLWSVMIPTFNCAKYLRQTLESVLAQDPGPEQMQIEVVDDCSTKDDPETVVQEVGKGRVAFYRKPKNEGAIPNFNACIQRSRGQLIHILHGDDYVLPGFYERLRQAALINPDVSILCSRCFSVDESGELLELSGRMKPFEQSTRNPGEMLYYGGFWTPGVVMRRAFYEEHGGFLTALVHTADWEMWVRAVTRGGGLALNVPLAAYRVFSGQDTSKLTITAENLRDCLRLSQMWSGSRTDFDESRFKQLIANRARQQAEMFRQMRNWLAHSANMDVWRQLKPQIVTFQAIPA